MKKMSVGKFKTNFSEVIERLKAGKKIAVTVGEKKVTGYFLSEIPPSKKKRDLGLLEGKVRAIFHADFKISEEDFLNL